MNSDNDKAPETPPDGKASERGQSASEDGASPPSGDTAPETSYYDDPYHDESDHVYHDPHASEPAGTAPEGTADSKGSGSSAPPPPPGDEDEDGEDDMARMSFLEHLDELRSRLLRALGGLAAVYVVCIAFAPDLLAFVLTPFYAAVEAINAEHDIPIKIISTRPLEQFQVQYIKVPLIAAVFIGSPWLMFQAWQFIAPGLYKREKRWAVPFILTTASLFILGGMFCYFVALRVTLQFLLTVSIGQVEPYISVNEYLNTFIILEIGLGLVFQLPVLIFFFTLLRLTTPRFLLRNVRYAVLIMFVIAAIITPTGDPLTMTLFAGPMIALYFVGIGASWLLVLRREGRNLPWLRIILTLLAFLAVVAGIVLYLHQYHGYGFTSEFPWFGTQ